jgi:hypothetical protein
MRRLWLLLIAAALAGLVYFASGSTRVFVEYPDGGVAPLQRQPDGFWALPPSEGPPDYKLCLGAACFTPVQASDGGWELHR